MTETSNISRLIFGAVFSKQQQDGKKVKSDNDNSKVNPVLNSDPNFSDR